MTTHQRSQDRARVAHYHQCPICFDFESCTMGCITEHDLGEHKGCPLGSHCYCSACEREGRAAAVEYDGVNPYDL